MTRLVTTGHVVRLVLHPHTAVGCEAECVAEFVGSFARRGNKACPGDGGNERVKFADDRLTRNGGQAMCCHERVPGQMRTERYERVRLAS